MLLQCELQENYLEVLVRYVRNVFHLNNKHKQKHNLPLGTNVPLNILLLSGSARADITKQDLLDQKYVSEEHFV